MTSVLIVEDDTTFRSTLARDLGSRNYSVQVASGVEEALATLARGQFEVLLTDLRLGGRDGIDLLKRVRTIAPATRSILMSGFASARDYQRAIELGAVRVLCKPFTSAELNQAIEHARDCSVGYSGNIHGLSLIDVLQLYQFGRKSIAIRVVGAQGGLILLRDGGFAHAECGELTGEAALIALLARPSGVLHSETLPSTYATTINRPAQAVLLDCLRKIDEGAVAAVPVPAEEPEPEPGSPEAEDRIARLRASWQQLIAGGPAVPDTSAVIGIAPVAGASVWLAGHGEPELWFEPLAGMAASMAQLCGARRGAMQANLGRVPVALVWDHDRDFCFLITDAGAGAAGNAWFRIFATAVARGVIPD